MSISRINMKTIKKKTSPFCHTKQFYFCIWFCVCNHASSTTPLQPKVKFKKFSLSTYSLLKKLETSDHSCYMLPFTSPTKNCFVALPHLGNSVPKRQVLNVPSQNRFFSAKTCELDHMRCIGSNFSFPRDQVSK